MTPGRFLSLPITLALVLAFAPSCSHKEDARKGEYAVDARAAEAAIRNASDDWGKAMTARDVDKTVSFYADGLRKYWAHLLALPGAGLTCDTTRVEVARSGELAYETGTCELTTKDLKGKSATEKQKYVVVWKKQAHGLWKAVVDIDNTD